MYTEEYSLNVLSSDRADVKIFTSKDIMYFDFRALIKYLLEGLAVAVAAFYIPQKVLSLQEIAILGLTAAAIFALLDLFTPSVGWGARHGAGWGIGWNMITEGFDGDADAAMPPKRPAVPDTDDEDDEDAPAPKDAGEGFCAF
jgi:hypothetical protein